MVQHGIDDILAGILYYLLMDRQTRSPNTYSRCQQDDQRQDHPPYQTAGLDRICCCDHDNTSFKPISRPISSLAATPCSDTAFATGCPSQNTQPEGAGIATNGNITDKPAIPGKSPTNIFLQNISITRFLVIEHLVKIFFKKFRRTNPRYTQLLITCESLTASYICKRFGSNLRSRGNYFS